MEGKSIYTQGWFLALAFFFLGIVSSGAIASGLEWIVEKGFLGNAYNYNDSMGHTLLFYLLNQIGWIFSLWFFLKVLQRQNLYALGFQWKGFQIDAGIGAGTAILIMVVGSVLLAMGDSIYVRWSKFDFLATLFGFLLFVVVAFFEEIIVRGYILSNLMRSLNKWIALFVSSILFTMMHITNENVSTLPLINIFLAGIVLGVNYIYTKNLWFAIFFHFAWNFTQGTVFGYHVSGLPIAGILETKSTIDEDFISGGSFGFEGSIFAALLQGVSIIGLAMFYENKYKPKKAVVGRGHGH